jgi:hypothetical protein
VFDRACNDYLRDPDYLESIDEVLVNRGARVEQLYHLGVEYWRRQDASRL